MEEMILVACIVCCCLLLAYYTVTDFRSEVLVNEVAVKRVLMSVYNHDNIMEEVYEDGWCDAVRETWWELFHEEMPHGQRGECPSPIGVTSNDGAGVDRLADGKADC